MVKIPESVVPYTPIATGVAAVATFAMAGLPWGASIGTAAVGVAAGIFAFTMGQKQVGIHLGAAATGAIAGTAMSRLRAKRTRDGFTWVGKLQNESYPSLPHSALVHVPAGFDAGKPFAVLVYFRGWNSCVTTLAGPASQPCAEGGRSRTASDIIGQVDRSGTNTILVMPEWPIEQESSDPGALGRVGGFREMIDEVMRSVVSPRLGATVRSTDASKIILAAHSGGYVPMAIAIRSGGLHRVDDLLLLDALYGDESVFREHAQSGGSVVTLYTSGTTERRSESLARSLGHGVLDDGAGPSEDQWRSPFVAAKVTSSHSLVPLGNLQAWLETRGLSAR